MKKKIITISILLLLLLLSGCHKKANKENNDKVVTPSLQPTTTPLPVQVSYKVEELYPLLADTEYVYEGSGNEYAAYTRVTDFLDKEKGRIQTRTINGGTETVRVLEIKDGKLTVVNMISECYYRENLLETEDVENKEILLMEPLIQGTEWTIGDGSKRYISAVDVMIHTPSGEYKTLEVTTKGDNYTAKDYYAPQVGLVKSIYQTGDSEVVSSLKAINTEKPFTQIIDVYYPHDDMKIYVVPTTLSFRTNDDTKQVLQETIIDEATKASYLPLASINTKINKIDLYQDSIHVDFSPELITDMNVGAGYEGLILQAITNTLGEYYGVQKVLITVNGEPYKSGHIEMQEGEYFSVNMDWVVKE